MMTQKEIAKQNTSKLEALVREKRRVLQELRFGKAERNTKAAQLLRTEIARALSELHRRTNEEAKTS